MEECCKNTLRDAKKRISNCGEEINHLFRYSNGSTVDVRTLDTRPKAGAGGYYLNQSLDDDYWSGLDDAAGIIDEMINDL